MDETHTLFEQGAVKIIARITEDDQEPDGDFDAEYFRRWQECEFEMVGIIARVELNGVTIGEDSLWGVEHGAVAEGVTADAWEFVPAVTEGHTVVMGSPLASVVDEALSNANEWLTAITAQQTIRDLGAARTWSDHVH
jgi:hypothetical protein